MHAQENETDKVRRSLQIMLGLLGVAFFLMFSLIYFFIFVDSDSKSEEAKGVAIRNEYSRYVTTQF